MYHKIESASKKISDKMLFPPYSCSEVINRLERWALEAPRLSKCFETCAACRSCPALDDIDARNLTVYSSKYKQPSQIAIFYF